LSFGAGAQYAYFFGTPTFKLSSFDLGGRIFPLPVGENPSGEFYLQGGVGLNLLVLPPAQGHFHGYAGLGYRQFLGSNLALDMGAQYDFYSPIAAASHGAAAKIGLTFLFGRTDWTEPVEEHKPGIRNFVVGAAWTGPSNYTWKVGDNLRRVAAKVYGDESFYPLLVDANKGLLADYRNLRPGARLIIPAPPQTQGEADRVEKSANENGTYLKWQTESEIYSQETSHQPSIRSYRWRKGDNLPEVAERLYGDDNLYPLLVDANEKSIIHPSNLVAGKVLRVPPLPADDELGDIRLKASNDGHYIWWRNVSLRN
jgi:nucleoid-associated protein YgaU